MYAWVRRTSRAFTLACLGAGLYAWLVEPRWLEVTRHAVVLPGRSLRIVHLSDLHTRGLRSLERRTLDTVSAEDPDLVVITGDVLSDRGGMLVGAAELDRVRQVLGGLRARLGVFAVRGNWEHWRRLEPPAALVEGTRVRLLDNAAAEIRPGLWLVGLDDACAGVPDEAAAFRNVPAGATAIALMHSPAPFPRLARRAALVLAGHSHGGQVRLPFLPPLWLPPQTNGFVAGWYAAGGSRLYVTRGVGTSILPVRLFCRPEIAVIDVRPQ